MLCGGMPWRERLRGRVCDGALRRALVDLVPVCVDFEHCRRFMMMMVVMILRSREVAWSGSLASCSLRLSRSTRPTGVLRLLPKKQLHVSIEGRPTSQGPADRPRLEISTRLGSCRARSSLLAGSIVE